MGRYKKLILFTAILIAANLYLLKPGFWFFQDAGYWPKTGPEAYIMLSEQLHSFTNSGYVIGFDQGLFGFTRIIVVLFITSLFYLFGHSGSQIIFSLSGYILSFYSFYLFSSIFFKDKNKRFILCLLYTFNPLTYSLEGAVFYNAISPLFIFSYHKYFYESKRIRISFLLVNIISSLIWVSYIRFLQSNFFVIIPYIIYLFFANDKKLSFKKTALFVVTYLLIFGPIILSFTRQIMERSQTAFFYGSIFGKFMTKYKIFDTFNIFQSIGVKFYSGKIWSEIGIIFFIYFIYRLLKFPRDKKNIFYIVNLSIITFGITIFALGNVFGSNLYFILIKILPFIINEPYWAFYVILLPFITLLGILFEENNRSLQFYSLIFITIATLPLLNLSNFQLQKFKLSDIPKPYYINLIAPYNNIPESTYYIPSPCWRAQYMDSAKTPTLCPNWGTHYSPMILSNPRLVSGIDYELSKMSFNKNAISNFRITHNLKYVIIPKDIKQGTTAGPEISKEDIDKTKAGLKEFDQNPEIAANKNGYFNIYYFKNKGMYDFSLYSPNTIIKSPLPDLAEKQIDIYDKPLFVNKENQLLKEKYVDAKISYKLDKFDNTHYLLKISDFDPTSPFLIQFNQAYGHNWKLKFVDEKYFNEKVCMNSLETFSATHNERCIFNNNLIDFNIVRYLYMNNVPEKNHFIGNFIGNGWIINPENIPDKYKNKKELFAVIIYEKQMYFTISIIICISTFVLLLVLTLIQEINLLKKPTNK